jgi:hypothetical protein
MLSTTTLFKRFQMNLQLLDQFGNHYCLGIPVGVLYGCRKTYFDLDDELLYGVVAGASIVEDLLSPCNEPRAWFIW